MTRRAWIVPPLAVAIAVVALAQVWKSPPKKTQGEERAVAVRTIEITEIEVVPMAVGYGTTRPARNWDAVAQVAGPIVWLSDKLENGSLVPAGEELLRIDASEYRLTLAQVKAQLAASTTKDRTTEASVAIEQRSLILQKTNLQDKRSLAERGIVSDSDVDTVNQQTLAIEARIQILRNALTISAAERDVLEVQKDLAELDLQRTVIRAPFDVRITEVKVGAAQFANKGQLLFSADGLALAEVEAQFSIGKLRPLIGSGRTGSVGPARAVDKIPGALALDATVRLKTATHDIEWTGRVDRVAGTIDVRTQSVGVVVAIDDPYGQASPGERPPLVRNTFVEVALTGQPHAAQVVIPTSALHEGQVYRLTQQNRLELRPVIVSFSQRAHTVLAGGLKPGDRIVVSDLTPAVQGMLLRPEQDERAEKQLIADARGEDPTQ